MNSFQTDSQPRWAAASAEALSESALGGSARSEPARSEPGGATEPATLTAPAPREHLDYLDGVRAIAALLITFHHALLQTWPIPIYPDAAPAHLVAAWSGWLFYANFGVIFFITLSGFCLMIPVIRRGHLRGGARGFLMYRLRRIAPPYYAALLVSTLIAVFLLIPHTHTLYDNSLPVTVKGVVYHALLIHNLNRQTMYQINGPFWSIAVEAQIYLLFPLFIWLWKRRGIVPVLALGFVLTAVLTRLVRGTDYVGLTPKYIFIFTMGMYASLLVFDDNYNGRTVRRIIALRLLSWVPMVALLPLIFPAQAGRLVNSHETAIGLVAGLISACTLVILGRNPRHIVRRFVSWTPLVWIGGFSYSLYLLHFPLQQLFWQAFVMNRGMTKGAGFALVSTVGTALICGVSWAFYRLMEKPFMRSKPRA